jgi:hypothetical protein
MESSILDTYFSDPPCRNLRLHLDYRIGIFIIRTCHDVNIPEDPVSPPTLRTAIELSLKTRINSDGEPRLKLLQFELSSLSLTIGDVIRAVEAMTGKTALIYPDTRGIILRGVGVANNEGWAAAGEAPWVGAKQAVGGSDRRHGSVVHTTENTEYLFVSNLYMS